jgi:hypothetical protein
VSDDLSARGNVLVNDVEGGNWGEDLAGAVRRIKLNCYSRKLFSDTYQECNRTQDPFTGNNGFATEPHVATSPRQFPSNFNC